MPRRPRLQFPGAVYHIVTRGDGRRKIFHDDGHYQRLTKGLREEVLRSAWEVIAFCWMPNHIHLLLRTPEPNLAAGMQHWLSGYANWYAKRNRRSGHLFQGRYKSFLVQDDSYFWTLSRYLHLNPCRGANPLAAAPDEWPHGSYPGYRRRSSRQDFVQYDLLHQAWRGECGGKDASSAYRSFVRQGLTGQQENPLATALRDWVIGSEEFLQRMIELAEHQEDPSRRGRLIRRLQAFTVEEVMRRTAEAHHVDVSQYGEFRSAAAGREMAALLCRRYTGCTLAELSMAFGLGHPSSSANLILVAKNRENASRQFRQKMKQIEFQLQPNNEH